jgi:hypothetical protein
MLACCGLEGDELYEVCCRHGFLIGLLCLPLLDLVRFCRGVLTSLKGCENSKRDARGSCKKLVGRLLEYR